MNLSNNQKLIVAGVLLFLLGAGTSYYLAPTKTVTETKVVTKTVVEWKEKETKKENKNLETIVIETRYPDGTVKTETRTIDKGVISIDIAKEGSKNTESTTTSKTSTQRGGPQWRLSGLAALDGNSNKYALQDRLVYGAGIERQIIGPVSAGVFGLTNSTYGVSVSISF